MLDTSNWREVSRFKGRTFQPERGLAFSSNTELVTAPEENVRDSPWSLAYYASETGRLIKQVLRPTAYSTAITDTIVVTGDQKYIGMIANQGVGTTLLFEAQTGRYINPLATPPTSTTSVLAGGPGAKLAVSVSFLFDRAAPDVRKEVYIFDAASNTRDRVLSGHVPGVGSVTWSPNGRLVATGAPMLTSYGDRKWIRDPDPIRVWDAATGMMIASFTGPYDPISALAWHPSNNVLATLSAKRNPEFGRAVRFWSIPRKELIFEFVPPTDSVITRMSFHPQTGHLVWSLREAVQVFEVLGLP